MTLDDADTSDDGHQVTLAVGDNVIKVKVTAEGTPPLETYTVTVNRAEAASTCTLNTGDLWCGVVTVEAVEIIRDDRWIRIRYKCRRPVRHHVQCRIERLHD